MEVLTALLVVIVHSLRESGPPVGKPLALLRCAALDEFQHPVKVILDAHLASITQGQVVVAAWSQKRLAKNETQSL